jgi:hypothetical protein
MSNTSGFNRATHFSVVWGVTLAVLTVMEWRSLDRDPMGHQILTPFIKREVTVSLAQDSSPEVLEFDGETGSEPETADPLRYEVEFHFNGPLFLACFFGPVLIFQGIGFLAARARKAGA